MLRAGLLKTSLVNYPGKVAAAVFLPGCNLRCPYCYNVLLATADPAIGPIDRPTETGCGDEGSANSYFTEEEIFCHLEKRARVLGGVAISGGEPLLSPFLEPLILKAKSLGLAVKVDTNGTLPKRLTQLIEDERLRPDMVAIDVKTAPKKYHLLARPCGLAPGDEDLVAAVASSVGRLSKAARDGLLAVEYRTVLVPGIVDEADVLEIAALLPKDAVWRFAPFMPGSCLNPAWNQKEPYTQEEMERLVAAAREIVPGAELRA